MILLNIITITAYTLIAAMIFIRNNTLLCTLFLATVLLLSTLILLMAHVEFLSYIFILVYVGGIAILFLFIIIMLNIKVSKVNKTNDFSSLLSGFTLLLLVLTKIQSTFFTVVSTSFINSHYLKIFSNMSVPSFYGDTFLYRLLSNDIIVFGMILYTHYVFYFILIGIILLVTMVCVLVLSLTESKNKDQYSDLFYFNKNKSKTFMKNSHKEFFYSEYVKHVGQDYIDYKPKQLFKNLNDVTELTGKDYNKFKTWYFWDDELPYLNWPILDKFIDSLIFIPIENLITYAFMLFFLSIIGLLFNNTQNVISFMLFIELMLFSLSFLSISFSLMWVSPEGQIFALFIMSIAVAESAIGLGLLIASFKISKRIELDSFSYLRG